MLTSGSSTWRSSPPGRWSPTRGACRAGGDVRPASKPNWPGKGPDRKSGRRPSKRWEHAAGRFARTHRNVAQARTEAAQAHHSARKGSPGGHGRGPQCSGHDRRHHGRGRGAKAGLNRTVVDASRRVKGRGEEKSMARRPGAPRRTVNTAARWVRRSPPSGERRQHETEVDASCNGEGERGHDR